MNVIRSCINTDDESYRIPPFLILDVEAQNQPQKQTNKRFASQESNIELTHFLEIQNEIFNVRRIVDGQRNGVGQ
jgi:hypothetical protein